MKRNNIIQMPRAGTPVRLLKEEAEELLMFLTPRFMKTEENPGDYTELFINVKTGRWQWILPESKEELARESDGWVQPVTGLQNVLEIWYDWHRDCSHPVAPDLNIGLALKRADDETRHDCENYKWKVAEKKAHAFMKQHFIYE
jgi:hypothetical protein